MASKGNNFMRWLTGGAAGGAKDGDPGARLGDQRLDALGDVLRHVSGPPSLAQPSLNMRSPSSSTMRFALPTEKASAVSLLGCVSARIK